METVKELTGDEYKLVIDTVRDYARDFAYPDECARELVDNLMHGKVGNGIDALLIADWKSGGIIHSALHWMSYKSKRAYAMTDFYKIDDINLKLYDKHIQV